jgi:hypothetical protein
MKRRTLTLLIVALLLLASVVVVWWFRSNFHPVTRTIPLPSTGEASYNPLYALKKTLQAQGVRVDAHPWLTPVDLRLPAGDTLVLYSRAYELPATQVQALLDWVGRGGNLVIPWPYGAQAPGSLTARLGLHALPAGDDSDDDPTADCDLLASDPAAQPMDFCGSRFLDASQRFSLSGGDAQRGYRFGRLRLGAGTVSVSSDLYFFNNDHLRQPVARELSYQMLTPRSGLGGVTLIYSSEMPSLLYLMLVYGWPALLPALLALTAWLAARSQRFGPLLPVPLGHRRALLEHIQASGEFAFRRARGATLHAAVLNLFRQRLQRRDPMLAVLAGDAQIDALAQRLNLDAARIRTAIAPTGLHRPDVFLHSISTLIQMRNRL